jgi:hypothetical protein
MRSMRGWVAGAVAVAALALATGCPSNEKDRGKATATGGATEKKGGGHVAPHKGAIAEWGDEEYHVEVTVDPEKKEAKAYIYGPDHEEMKEATIAADKLLLSMKKPAVFQLTLTPENRKGGKASVYSGKDDRLGEKGPIEGTVSAEFGGKQYSGPFRKK